ncbi:MAG: wax ester/triacylglycerol synthase family O-acyltransferase [Deltaproteobacteria bacterium]|nr:wax ester/triacylglycerol synthase family O-acyltransferase [Deltaproteobacteria bacterium]
MPKPLSALDKLFLYLETRETMMHVAGLMPFTPPPDAPPDFLRELMAEVRESREVRPPWNLELATPRLLRNPLQAWVEDAHLDLDYHVRRSALPEPGDERELGVLVSRLHSNQVDFHRPPWELHLIENLEGGRFALYVKCHHSLVDGITSMRILARSLSTDPAERKSMFFTLPPPERTTADAPAADFGSLLRQVRSELSAFKSVGLALASLGSAARGRAPDLTPPLKAPPCILNARIGRNRRFATQKYQLDRLKQLAKTAGGTLNDVVIALCAGGLRRFLQDLGQLPEKPLVAFLPVNIRPKDDPGGGNAVGAILASMATDLEDPRARLEAIIASTQRAKEQLQGMSQSAMLAYSALLMAPFGLQSLQALAGVPPWLPVTFNVCISNVPGPDKPLYFRGARLEASYPVSIPTHGMALNITCQSYAGTLGLGFIGCRDTLPHLQKLAVYTGEALQELEKALESKPTSRKASDT